MMKPADVLAIVQMERGELDAATVMAVLEQESGKHLPDGTLTGFDERAFLEDRNGGSYGLGQIDMPTARQMGFFGSASDLYDPRENVRLTVKYLAWIKRYLAANSMLGLESTIAAYNEGVGNVRRGVGDPRYVGSVLGYRQRWQQQLGGGVS